MGMGEGPAAQHRLWVLPQRRKWAACGHWARVPAGGQGPVSNTDPCSVHAGRSGVARLWDWDRQGTSTEAVCALPEPGPKAEAHPSEVFPEAHFLWLPRKWFQSETDQLPRRLALSWPCL